MQKKLLFLSKVILSIAALNLICWSVYYVHTGGTKLGFLTPVIKEFSSFPTVAARTYREMTSPERLLRTDPNFEQFNKLDYDLYAVNSTYSAQLWTVQLKNLKDDSTLYQWFLPEKIFKHSERKFSNAEPQVPIILPDTSLIIHNNLTNNLYRLNPKSEIVWHNQDYEYHHSINQDYQGNIWACASVSVESKENKLKYRDDFIVLVDKNTGETLFQKSISQLLDENGMPEFVHGFCNGIWNKKGGTDPLHLNDIEPVLEDGTYWKTGDLFLSLRNRSLVFQYRPATNKVIRVIQGPFYNQHDVDILSDSTISIFNNNISSLAGPSQGNSASAAFLDESRVNMNSEVLIYDLNDSSFTSLYPQHFAENKVLTKTQGLDHLLHNGDLFVESHDEGKIYIFNSKEVVLKKYAQKPERGGTQYPNWMRIYENLDFLK